MKHERKLVELHLQSKRFDPKFVMNFFAFLFDNDSVNIEQQILSGTFSPSLLLFSLFSIVKNRCLSFYSHFRIFFLFFVKRRFKSKSHTVKIDEFLALFFLSFSLFYPPFFFPQFLFVCLV